MDSSFYWTKSLKYATLTIQIILFDSVLLGDEALTRRNIARDYYAG